jgi:hypothetical protein
MTNSMSAEPTSALKRLWSNLTAIASALELDGYTHQDLRIAGLERRMAALEATKSPRARDPEGR